MIYKKHRPEWSPLSLCTFYMMNSNSCVSFKLWKGKENIKIVLCWTLLFWITKRGPPPPFILSPASLGSGQLLISVFLMKNPWQGSWMTELAVSRHDTARQQQLRGCHLPQGLFLWFGLHGTGWHFKSLSCLPKVIGTQLELVWKPEIQDKTLEWSGKTWVQVSANSLPHWPCGNHVFCLPYKIPIAEVV